MSSNYERELVRKINALRGWRALRAGGSEGEADVMAIPREHGEVKQVGLLIEVKRTQQDKKDVRKRQPDQWEHYVDLHDIGYNVLYAVRHTRGSQSDRWQIHPIREALETDYPHILRRPDGIAFNDYFQEV